MTSSADEVKIRESIMKFIRSSTNDDNGDLLREVDYETKCSVGVAQRVLYKMLGEGLVRICPGVILEIVEQEPAGVPA